MNRIYQGRVTRVETLLPEKKGKCPEDWEELPDWEDRLWRHHQLFQDAVNYYLVALAALGQSSESPLSILRQRMEEVWNTVEKQGQRREGLAESFRRQFSNEAANDFRSAAAVSQEAGLPNAIEAEKAAHYLMSKATGDSGIQQQGPVLWPQFCNPGFSGNFAGGGAETQKAKGFYLLSTKLHEVLDDDDMKRFARERDLSEVVKTDPKGGTHPDTKLRLKKSILHFLKCWIPLAADRGTKEKIAKKRSPFLSRNQMPVTS